MTLTSIMSHAVTEPRDCYAAWQPDPGAAYIDTFLLDWSMVKTVYMSPPYILKYQGSVEMIVVYLEWKGSIGFPSSQPR